MTYMAPNERSHYETARTLVATMKYNSRTIYA
nr:MAG TPA: hypothetical protein [Caudoviricetes sp.]